MRTEVRRGRRTHRFEGAIQLCVFIEYLCLHWRKGRVALIGVLIVVEAGHEGRERSVGSCVRCGAIWCGVVDVHKCQSINVVFDDCASDRSS